MEKLKNSRISKLLPIFVSIGLIVVIFYKINWQDMLLTLQSFDKKYLLSICGIYIVALFLRGVRWKYLLLKEGGISSLTLSNITTVGTMMNTYLPARAGDFWRAIFLGNKAKISRLKIFGSIILERIFDGISLFFILLTAVLLYCRQDWILIPTYFIGLGFIGAFIAVWSVLKFNKTDTIFNFFIKIFPEKEDFLNKIKHHTNHFTEGFGAVFHFKWSFFILVLSFAIWFCEALSVYFVINSFDFVLNFSAAFFVISFIAFGTMIPSSSIFLGPFQYAYVLALGIYGLPKSVAVAISFVDQIILMITITVIGLISYLKYNYQKDL